MSENKKRQILSLTLKSSMQKNGEHESNKKQKQRHETRDDDHDDQVMLNSDEERRSDYGFKPEKFREKKKESRAEFVSAPLFPQALIPRYLAEGQRPLSISEFKDIEKIVNANKNQPIFIAVASTNNMKTKAATVAIKQLLFECGISKTEMEHRIQTFFFECDSKVPEQPIGYVQTRMGASNRSFVCEKQLIEKSGSVRTSLKNPTFIVSMENGLLREDLEDRIIDEEYFIENFEEGQQQEEEGEEEGVRTLWQKKIFVDRCFVQVTFCADTDVRYQCHFFSEGVMAPIREVNLSLKVDGAKTAGSFIAAAYDCDAKDWHKKFTGKSRVDIIEEAVKNCLCLPFKLPKPEILNTFKSDVFTEFVSEPLVCFTPKTIHDMIENERSRPGDSKTIDDSELWRGHYKTIPQSSKPGADQINPANNIGIYLAEDLIVLYENEGVIHAVLLWAKKDSGEDASNTGWVLPGKRDRAYAPENPDISIQDAMFDLLKKELKISRTDVAHYFPLGYFDDRIREIRMKVSTFVSMIFLKKKPPLRKGEMIGVPFNILKELVKRQIKLPKDANLKDTYGFARNHDSILLQIFKTNVFYSIMDRFNSLSPNAKEFPTYNRSHTCKICEDLLVNSLILCKNGHTVCGKCEPILSMTPDPLCPFCKESILTHRIRNIGLNDVIMEHYPVEYMERLQEVTPFPVRNIDAIKTYEQSDKFNGKFIQYQ